MAKAPNVEKSVTPELWETPEGWERLKPLFGGAMQQPQEQRAKYIDEVCGDDLELRDALFRLLRANQDSISKGDGPIVDFHNLFSAAKPAFTEGELVSNQFRIVRLIGSGGMGDVYEAIDLELGRRIALKTIRPEIASSPRTLAHFKKEVVLAQRISGPHVCRIHAFHPPTDSAGRTAFLTMEYLDGITLADKIRESRPLPWSEVKTIALEICEGLRVMHEAGIIHRDLKSRNVMLANRNGTVSAVVMDFGLAHEVRSATSETETDVSAEQGVAGTIDYMAPEQFAGDPLTPAADIFALGVVMYELATGRHPFPSGTILQAAIRRGQRPPGPSSIQKGLPHRCDEIVCRCLEFDPKKRYGSVKIVAEEIEDKLPAKLRRTWLRMAAAFVAVVALTSGLLLVPAIRERVQGILFSSREKHIAVLPLEVAGSDPQTQALGDGLMDSLAGKLSNLDSANQTLWVVPASEVRARKVHDASSALKEFGATIVVQGNFERNGTGAHLRLTLINPQKMREIGFADVQNATGDLAALEDEAVTSLGRLMNVSVKENLVRDSPGQIGRDTYEDYLAGLGYMQRYDKIGNLDAAIKSFQKAVTTDPQFALGFAQLGEAYRLKYQLDRNDDWLKKATVFCNQAINLDKRTSAAYVTLAIIQEATGNHELAVQEFQRALDNDPRDTKALSGLAYAYEQVGRLTEAESILKKAAALRPTYWDGYNTLGTFYRNHGKIPQAIAQFKRALTLTPDNAQVYANLGAAYIDSGDPKLLPDAEDALKRSIALQPSYMALANLGALYAAQNRYAEAADATEKALQINGNDWIVWSNLVAIYEWLKLPAKAAVAEGEMLKLLEKTVQLKPEDAQAQSALAVIYAHTHLNEKAMDRIQTSLALAPNDPVVLSSVGDAYELSGHRALAITFIHKALKNGLTQSQVEQDPYLQRLISDPAFQSARISP
jgi:serine/threonine protein kinase/Flp pilus assembly protein TadD/TolB-like protein